MSRRRAARFLEWLEGRTLPGVAALGAKTLKDEDDEQGRIGKDREGMVAPGKGILAADESSGTIKKRFDAIGVEFDGSQPARLSRDAVPHGRAMKNIISGVILYDETICQNAKDGTPLVKLIAAAGSLPGIKVDKGTKPLPFSPQEVDHRRARRFGERLIEYRKRGARFAKWRAVIDIGAGHSRATTHHTNTHALARYAALCQEATSCRSSSPKC